MKPWIILFDWDGTLIDSMEIKIHNAGQLFNNRFGIAAAAVEKIYHQASGITRRQLFEKICIEMDLPVPDKNTYQNLSDMFTDMNLRALGNPSARDIILPETEQALDALQQLGIPMYVSSSADRNEIYPIARMLGLEGYFEELLGSSAGFGKGRQHAEYVLRKQAASLEQLIFIGDEPADIHLGREAGMVTIARAGTHTVDRLALEHPDYIINSLMELPSLLDRLAAHPQE